jgi:hypothetical protein
MTKAKYMNLNNIAISNLELLCDLDDNIEEYNLVVDGNNIQRSTDENYDGIFSLRELEYPIYFSFHQLLNSLRYSNLYRIEDYKTSEIIQLLDESIDKVVDILDKTQDDPQNNVLCQIIDDVDDKYDILRERHDTCSFWKVYETLNDYLDTFSEALMECNRYLYVSSKYSPIFMETVNKETGETDPNLIYSDDELEEEIINSYDDSDDNSNGEKKTK